MQRNNCSSVLLLGAVAALLAGCCGETEKQDANALVAAPGVSNPSPPSCDSAKVAEDLVGPTWTVDNAWCGTGCPHPHVHLAHTFSFTKNGVNFDIHGSYETTGGAIEPNPNLEDEVRGKIRASHDDGEIEHWFTAQLYVPEESRCGKPEPYDLRVAVCENMPNSYDACKGDGQHGGYAHSHP